jgi:hypothetical protein
MSLSIQLRAPRPELEVEDLWDRIRAFLENEAGDALRECHEGMDEQGEYLVASLHPGEEGVEFHLVGEEFLASATTSNAGPGYHEYVLSLLYQLAADLGLEPVSVADPTGYSAAGDRAALEASMEAFLREVCQKVAIDMETRPKRVQIGMTMDSIFQYGEGVLTPMGPQTWAWAEDVARGERAGHEYFSWWDSGQDARYFLNRALCLMWSEVRWKAPGADEEVAVLEEAVRSLEAARELDANLDYPYREWNEMLVLLEREPEEFAEADDEALVGYRRGWVREALAAGWSILLPGNMDGAWDEGAWSGGNEELTVQFQSFRKDGPKQEEWTEEAMRGMRMRGEEELEFDQDGLIGKACIYEDGDDDGPFFQLDGRVARTGNLAVLTVNFQDETQREAAEKIWRSLRVARS